MSTTVSRDKRKACFASDSPAIDFGSTASIGAAAPRVAFHDRPTAAGSTEEPAVERFVPHGATPPHDSERPRRRLPRDPRAGLARAAGDARTHAAPGEVRTAVRRGRKGRGGGAGKVRAAHGHAARAHRPGPPGVLPAG